MHIALICPDHQGHLNPMGTLGQELLRRGHRVGLVGMPDAEAKADACDFEFHPIGLEEHAVDAARADLEKLAGLKGIAAFRFTVELLQRSAGIFLRDAPDQLRKSGAEVAVVDQVSHAGIAVAEVLKLPFVVACNALAMHLEPGVPPCLLHWRYRAGLAGRLRNRLGNSLVRYAARPIYATVLEYCRRNGISSSLRLKSDGPGLAQIAQQPEFFDFPRKRLPSHFHYTGPWHGPKRDTETVEFPWEKLDGRPLVYASLGTMQNRLQHVFRAILDACAGRDLQVVLSLGRKGATWTEPAPANAIVVPFAPQLKMLERASLLVTHAGLNTALEGLSRGLPMLCLPVTNDQPGVARRVEWLGAGEVLKPGAVRADRIGKAIDELLAEPRYRAAADKCREKLEANPGVARAADIVEEAFRTGQRVDRAAGSDARHFRSAIDSK